MVGISISETPNPQMGPNSRWKSRMNGGTTWENPNREPGLHLTPGAFISLCLLLHLKKNARPGPD